MSLSPAGETSPHSPQQEPAKSGLPGAGSWAQRGILSVWEMTDQENIHAFATMEMKISHLLVKSISLFRDKSKCESLLSVINSLQGSPLSVSVV